MKFHCCSAAALKYNNISSFYIKCCIFTVLWHNLIVFWSTDVPHVKIWSFIELYPADKSVTKKYTISTYSTFRSNFKYFSIITLCLFVCVCVCVCVCVRVSLQHFTVLNIFMFIFELKQNDKCPLINQGNEQTEWSRRVNDR